MKNTNIPRKPTKAEKLELFDYISKVDKRDNQTLKESYAETVDSYDKECMVVFDTYETYFTGYIGKLLIIAANLHPSHYKAFLWRNGKIQEVIDE